MGKVIIHVREADGKRHTFVLPENVQKSIVDIAEEEGVELPYSCRSGACFSCCAEIKQGAERLDHEKTGEKLIDTEPNECLCCIGGVKAEAFQQSSDVEIDLEMLN